MIRWPDRQGNPDIRECRVLAPVRPRMQASGLQCLKLQIAVAFPDPQPRTFPGTGFPGRSGHPNFGNSFIWGKSSPEWNLDWVQPPEFQIPRTRFAVIPVSVNKNTPFTRAFALQACGINCIPAPDLVLWKLIFQCVSFSGGFVFSQTPVGPAIREKSTFRKGGCSGNRV